MSIKSCGIDHAWCKKCKPDVNLAWLRNRNRTQTVETREKISAALKGRKITLTEDQLARRHSLSWTDASRSGLLRSNKVRRIALGQRWESGEISASDPSGWISSWARWYIRQLHGSPACWKCGWIEVHSVHGGIPTQIEHIDGNAQNNQFSNISLLCPNCHSLTPTWGGLNRGNGRKGRYIKD
jgi:hypothetical protein